MNSESVRNFMFAAEETGIFLKGFDWFNWGEGIAISRAINKSIDIIGELDELTVRKLLTSFVRQNLFYTGFLACMFENGVMLKLTARLAELT